MVNLSCGEALELVEGSSGGGGESGTLACNMCMLFDNVPHCKLKWRTW